MRKRKKRIVAGTMVAIMMAGSILCNISPLRASETGGNVTVNEKFNKEGLWITEIYQNDVDRSEKNNSRETSGYESIRLYKSTTDLMEFVEITSTYDKPVNFNDTYEFVYNDTALQVSTMDGSSDVVIQPEEKVVLWNYRSDIKTPIPTEAEFREEMRIPDDAVVLKVTSEVNWGVTSTFSLRTKSDQNVISTFTATDKVDTMDGFSVELAIPDIGNEMQVYREMCEPSPGYIYSGQLNGLVKAKVPDSQIADGVFITEVRPNDVNRKSTYGIADDLMECVEIVNTTDHDVDLNNEYQFGYEVKEGSRKILELNHYDDNAENGIGSSDSCIIPAGKTAVIWFYRVKFLKGYTSFTTEKEFRDAYKISDDVPVYLVTGQNGMNNTNRAVELYKKNSDGTKKLVSYYAYVGNSDCKDNKSAELMVNPEGPEMILKTANAATSMGSVSEAQYTYVKDDGSALGLALDDVVPSSIMQGDELRVNFRYDVTGSLPRTGITTYYRFDGAGSWYSTTEVNRRVPNLYESLIPADELFSHDYVEFYVSADNRYRSTYSDIYRVDIKKLNAVDGIRTNITDNEQVRGIVSITANDGENNSNSKIYVDGVQRQTEPMLEDGAYFTFHAEGRDSYFKNAVTTTDNEVIASIGKWQYQILDGQAIHIDNRYFKYNEEKAAYDVTLRFWAGTYGATVDEYLLPDANREDFTVKNLALKLINGNIYYPKAIGPDNEDTSTKTNLSTDYETVHYIGDSTGMCPYMDVSFTIPSSEVTAVGTQVDTTKLSDGEHILKVTNGTSTKEVTFIVDNKAPEIELGVNDGDVLRGNITLNPKVTETNTLDEFVVTLDGEQISDVYETTSYALGDGVHTIAAFAKDAAGNETTKSASFTVEGAQITIISGGTSDVTDNSASLYLNVKSDNSDTTTTFYKAEKIDTDSIKTNTSEGILPYIQYTVNVPDVKDDEIIAANWNGEASNSDGTHAGTMYVLNTASNKWDEIAKADEKGNIKEASFTAANHVKDGNATIIVQCTADSALPELDTVTDKKKDNNASWDGTNVPEDYDFCFAWETDTQYYAEEWQHHFTNINNWIVNNKDERKIKYVIHTGDIVDDVDMTYEWENADAAMGILDKAGMPYGVLGGNHDVAAGLADYENYYKYFGENRFASQPTYGGTYQNNKGHYDLISEGGQDFIIVYMSWNIYQDEIDWMNQVLSQYSDRKAILCFHTYTNVKQSNGTYLDYYGQLVNKYVVKKNPNVFAVLNGHYHGSSYETAMFDDDGDGRNDRTVYQICTDYQSGFEGGNEYIKFLYFDLDNNKIYMNSYSPCMDDFNYYDTELHTLNVEGASATGVDQMVLDVDFDTKEQKILEKSFSAYVYTNEELGKAVSTQNAVLNMTNLSENTDYAWYAVVTNETTGIKKSSIYEFTTAKKNDSNIADGENQNGADTDKTGSIVTGDVSKAWIFALLGLTVSAAGAVIVIKKKEA
ncbi:metallophosphoesterase [Lachnospira eligens]|jgi:hypothetical protein|uniref:metallophosphoesterase n=1 Tax=Lachnospira eligens TaxID=39485 RepID=UPI000E52DEB6|nr:metallophosphoesterase [Lachnospira eligens]RGT56651.1 hypothetical protein DWX21_00905 [Lachnospira eligens]